MESAFWETKKRAPLVLVALLCAAMCVLSGCGAGPSPEKMMRDTLTQQLDALADSASDEREAMASVLEKSGLLQPYGVDAKAFCQAFFEGFAYKIETVTVDEEKGSATATVDVKAKSLANIADAALEEVKNLAAGKDASALTEAEVNARLGKRVMQAVQDAPLEETQVKIAYTRDDKGVWSANEDAAAKIADALLGKASPA